MSWFEWNEEDYPICPLCKRASVVFHPYKKGILRIHKLKLPEGKIPAVGRCLWSCEFKAIVPLSWLGNKLIDPNNVLKEYV